MTRNDADRGREKLGEPTGGRPQSDKGAAAEARGADQFAIAWRLTAAGWLGCALLQLILYLRPSPYGGPFLVQWKAFIIRPLVYELLAVWLIALAFLLLWLALYRR